MFLIIRTGGFLLKNDQEENHHLVDVNFMFEVPKLTSNISVLRELTIEIGCEINTVWEDGRLHMPVEFNSTLVEASITNPEGEESKILNVNYQEVQSNASNGQPYFKSVSPLGTNSGKYMIKVYAKALCVKYNLAGYHFLFSVIPRVKMYVDGDRNSVVDVSYPPICKEQVSTETETTQEWPILYEKE